MALPLGPSPGRNALIQQLLQQSQSTVPRSRSPQESLAIAAQGIIPALLSRQQQAASQQQGDALREQLSKALGLPQDRNVMVDQLQGGQEQFTAPAMRSPQQQSMQALVQALAPEQAQELIGGLAAQRLTPQKPDIREVGNQLVDVTDPSRAQTVFTGEGSPTPQMISLTKAEKEELNIPTASFAQRNSETGEIKIDDPPSALVQVNTGDDGSFKLPSGFMLADKGDPSKGVVPIPGGPAARESAEQAGRRALLEGGQESVRSAFEILAPDGQPNRAAIAAMQARIPGTQGRRARLFLEEAMAARLRSETGAQMNEQEVDLMRERVMPTVLDSDQEIAAKQRIMERFFTRAESSMEGKSNAEILEMLASEVEQEAQNIDTELPEGVTEDDITFTMEKHGLTREQVLERIR